MDEHLRGPFFTYTNAQTQLTKAFFEGVEREQQGSEASPAPDSNVEIDIEERNEDGRKVQRYKFNQYALDKYFGGRDPYQEDDELSRGMDNVCLDQDKDNDILTKLCVNVELAVQLGKQLEPESLLNLYIACKAFRDVINSYMLSSVRIWIAERCPEAGHIFPFKMYKKQLIPDPAGRTWRDMYKDSPAAMSAERMDKIRTIPGLKYYQLVLGRDRCCREIIAIMARNGHLLPKTMYETLLRLWLLMDVGVTKHRLAMLRNKELWRDRDLYNVQLLTIKLGLHCNDPVWGPCSYELVHLCLAQKGLYTLWQVLMRKKFTTISEFMEAKVRHDFDIPDEAAHLDALEIEARYGVPVQDIAKGHLEGWGKGTLHLVRPDELVAFEAVDRGLELDKHLRYMIFWGYFDWITGENLVPTEEDMYIADAETKLAHMDTVHHWRKRHALKKRWNELTKEQQDEIREEDEDERLRAMAWCGEPEENEEASDPGIDPWTDEPAYNIHDELDRGFIVPQQAADHQSSVPALADQSGWEHFVNRALMGLPEEISEDDKLRFQAMDSSLDPENFDWIAFMRDEGFDV